MQAKRNLGLAKLAFTLCFAAWSLISPFAKSFKHELGLSYTEALLLTAVTVVLGSLLRIPVGTLTDSYRRRRVRLPETPSRSGSASCRRSIPDASLMASAPWIYQAHVLASLTLFALWPFSRLVHVWTMPVQYVVRRAHILYRGPLARPRAHVS